MQWSLYCEVYLSSAKPVSSTEVQASSMITCTAKIQGQNTTKMHKPEK